MKIFNMLFLSAVVLGSSNTAHAKDKIAIILNGHEYTQKEYDAMTDKREKALHNSGRAASGFLSVSAGALSFLAFDRAEHTGSQRYQITRSSLFKDASRPTYQELQSAGQRTGNFQDGWPSQTLVIHTKGSTPLNRFAGRLKTGYQGLVYGGGRSFYHPTIHSLPGGIPRIPVDEMVSKIESMVDAHKYSRVPTQPLKEKFMPFVKVGDVVLEEGRWVKNPGFLKQKRNLRIGGTVGALMSVYFAYGAMKPYESTRKAKDIQKSEREESSNEFSASANSAK